MLAEGLPKNDLDSFRGHLLIGSNFFSLLKPFIWVDWYKFGILNDALYIIFESM